ncbi:MAG: hypothetical protein J6D30_01715 [Clostridia bacterium]|nr:hypothetical protein [Clostridia bacterium]MBP3423105.1 hypothetical protein [Clostridia bacterium]
MKNAVKFFFLGYFSNQTAKQAQKRGLGIMFLTIAVSVVLLLVGFITSATLPVRFLYEHAGDVRTSIEKTFANVQMTVTDGKIVAGISEQGNQLVVNTITNQQDKQNYSVNGFEIVVDTRQVGAFDDFSAVCVTAGGKEISYEDYLALDEEVKSLYTFRVTYSGKERVIDAQWQARCESYLDTVTDETIAKEYTEVKKLPKETYADGLYELYVKAYYPDLSRYETNGGAPKLRNSYTHNYKDEQNILFVFDDSLILRFTSENGEQHIFYGFYLDMPNGAVESNFNSIHTFFLQSFESANVIIVYSCMINFIMIMPYLIFISFIVMIIMYCLCKIINKEGMQFGAVAKIACNFLLWTVIFTDLIVMALSLFISQSRLFGMACVVFFAAFLVRAVLFVIAQWRKHRLELAECAANDGEAAEQFQANQTEE